MPIWTKEWISTATLNVANGSHGNTLTEVDSPLNFHRQRNIKFSVRRHILYNKINLLVVPKVRPLRSKFQKSPRRRHENSIVGMDPMATHCRTKMLWPDKKILFKKQLFDLEVKGQGPTKVITVCDTPPYGYIIDLSGKTKKGMVRTSFAEKKWKKKKSD